MAKLPPPPKKKLLPPPAPASAGLDQHAIFEKLSQVDFTPPVVEVEKGAVEGTRTKPRQNIGKKVGWQPKLAIRDGKLPAQPPRSVPRKKLIENRPCLCGCGMICGRFFIRGHINRFNAALASIANGSATPQNALSKFLVDKLGPWKQRGSGQVPTHDYTTVYDK